MSHESTDPFIPRPHQDEARAAILGARERGRPGFLLGDLTGLGKTLSAWSAVSDMPEGEVLILCPKGAIPQWRRTIARWRPTGKAVTILNFERTKSLMAPPQVSTRRSVRGKNNELAKLGSLKRHWDLVVIDEAHRIRNPNSQQGLICRKLIEAARFTVFLSATAGQTPFELSYLGRLLASALGLADGGLDGFRALMKRIGIGRPKGRWKNWTWVRNEDDRRTLSDLLYKGPSAIGLRRRPEEIAGWPEVQREVAPVSLDGEGQRLYEATWREFRRELGLAGGSTRTPRGWAADLRFRQKASLLRVPGTIDFAQMLLDEDQQVAVSVAFLETSALLAEGLRGRGWRVGEINGERKGGENEATRVAFQTGQLDAVVFTVTESISLHRGELPGGERERSLIVHDMRHSAVELAQVEGRAHRDGQRAIIYYAFAEGTVEETIAVRAVERMAAMDGMAGDDTRALDDIARAIEEGAGDEDDVTDPALRPARG
ncbi:DEAD/DEAH box helicase [uncultured Alsobacter sp.]|uniref:DEAD/DEAH box helicase n=1 Tax=uncultured Alsobacter sp. TaxID=1748258 RepID=UPI0025FE4AC8|nr:DEAD/DEAH box helicase [uncultured Alsobacter sp.]